MFQYPLQKSFSPGFSNFHSGHYGLPISQIAGQMDLSLSQNDTDEKSQHENHCYSGFTEQNQSFFDSGASSKLSEFGSGNDLSNEGLSAWLGPQVWSSQICLEASTSDLTGEQPKQVRIKREKLFNEEWEETANSLKDLIASFLATDQVDISHSDLSLASSPGSAFDPRMTSFSQEELKPQPIIRKRRKSYVPDAAKTEDYWHKRITNNIAARKSREAKRLRDNQIALRAAYLEKENVTLKDQVEALSSKNIRMEEDVQNLLQQIEALKHCTFPNS